MSGTKIAAACVVLSFGVIVTGLVILAVASSFGVASVGMAMAITGCVAVLCSMHVWTYFSGAS